MRQLKHRLTCLAALRNGCSDRGQGSLFQQAIRPHRKEFYLDKEKPFA